MEAWKVFKTQDGRELCAYTVRGESEGEERATILLKAYENGLEPEAIITAIEERE